MLEQQEKYEFIWLLMIQAGTVSVKVLETKDRWFGVTYAEDKDSVADSFKQLAK